MIVTVLECYSMLLCFKLLLVIVFDDLDSTGDDHKGCSLLIGSRSFVVLSDLRSQTMLLTFVGMLLTAGIVCAYSSCWCLAFSTFRMNIEAFETL